MKIIKGSMMALMVLIGVAHGAVVFEDFESFSDGQNINGVGGWGFTGAADNARVTPDPVSGYSFVLEGSRSSYVTSGQAFKFFTSTPSITWGNTDTVVYSALYASTDGIPSGQFDWFMLSPTSSGATGAAIYMYNDGTGPRFWLDGTGFSDTGVSLVTGGGGAPTLNAVYRLSMAVNFATNQFEGFYEDTTSDPGNTISLGTHGMSIFGGGLDTGNSYLALGNIRLGSTSGSRGAWDEITVVPEPTSFAFLGMFVIAFLLLRRFRAGAAQS